MRSAKYLLIVAGLLCVGSVFVACGDDDTENKDTDNSEETDNKETDDTDTGDPSTDEGETESETVEPVHPDVAFDENFDAWDGGGAIFFMSKPEEETSILEGNNTAANIADHDCVMFHALSVDNYGYGTAIEAQFQLLEMGVDMSAMDYEISFDIYLPQEMKDKNVNIQFAFFETTGYTPIYSIQYADDIAADTWTTITSPILWDDDKTYIDYSGFDETVNPNTNPEDWQFDVVRIQAVINEPEDETDTESAVDGQELTFYLDNLKVYIPK